MIGGGMPGAFPQIGQCVGGAIVRAVWVPLVGALAVAVATFAFMPVATQAQQVAAGPAAQPSPAAKPSAPSQAPAAQPSPAAKPAAPAASPAAAPAQAPRPAASPAPAGLPRTGEADNSPIMWLTAVGGIALVGGGLLLVRRRRSSKETVA